MNSAVSDDDEEDFLALVEGKNPEPAIVGEKPVTPESIDLSSDEHIAVSEIPTGLPEKNEAHSGVSFEEFKASLYDFYAKYNFGNLDKVPYLAEKFFFRRWELWKQLSMKYHLSPRESSELWIRFNVRFDGVPECSRRLFGSHETVVINSDSAKRREAWSNLLCVSPDTQQDQYHKHCVEITQRSSTSPTSSPSTQSIHLDVVRTHQELSYFQEESTKEAMVRILTVYCELNGVRYVQGMNEILAVIIFVLRDESDSFWAFNSVMFQLKDLFTAEVDSTNEGIYSRIDHLRKLLAEYDFRFSKTLERADFPFATIAMRWLTTLLGFDLTLPDTIQLWDIMIQAAPKNHMLSFAVHVCLAYLMDMSATVRSESDEHDMVHGICNYGKSTHFNVDALINQALAIHAYETNLRGEYSPTSDEPILEALGDAVGVARDRIRVALESVNTDQVKEEVTERLTVAKTLVSNWFTNFTTTDTDKNMIPSPKAQESNDVFDSA